MMAPGHLANARAQPFVAPHAIAATTSQFSHLHGRTHTQYGVARQPLPLLIIWWHTSNGAGFGKLEMAQMCGAWATGNFAKRMKLAAS